MRKLLILLFFLSIANSYAGPPARNLNTEKMINNFNNWLSKNGHSKYLEIVESEKCNSLKKYSQNWFYNNCDQTKYKNNLDIKIYTQRGTEIPNKARPNDDTLLFYAFDYIEDYKGNKKFLISPSKNPYKFESNLIDDKDVKKEIVRKKSPLLSYLLFEDDKIIIDEITPKNKFGIVFQNDTQWVSHSIGKSFVSYITGHAICGGYIESVDSRLNDWDVLKNTLYEDQKLIDIFNMSSGDQNHVTERDGLKKSGRWFNSHRIKSFAENELKGTEKI